jgi:hypothetical protein
MLHLIHYIFSLYGVTREPTKEVMRKRLYFKRCRAEHLPILYGSIQNLLSRSTTLESIDEDTTLVTP